MISHVVPLQIQNRIREYAAFLVNLLQLQTYFHDDVAVRQAVPEGLGTRISPLHPAPTVGNAAFLFNRDTGGKHEDFCRHILRNHVGPLPERAGFIVKEIDVYHPFEIGHGFAHFSGIGAAACRIHAPGKKALDTAFVHLIKDIQPGIRLAFIQLGHPGIAEFVFSRSLVSEKGFQKADDIFRFVLPPVQAERILALGPALEQILQLCNFPSRGGDIAGPDMKQQGLIRGSLHIGLAP